MTRTCNGFPVVSDPADIAVEVSQFVNSTQYVLWVLETFVWDTPFTKEDLVSVHELIQDYHRVPYKSATISRQFFALRKEGKLVPYGDSDYVVFAANLKKVKKPPTEVKVEGHNFHALCEFYTRILTKLCS